MKTRTVTLEVEIEGGMPDALELRDEVEKLGLNRPRVMHPGSDGWRVRRAEVLEQRDGWRVVRTGPCRHPDAELGQCGCRELIILEERQGAA